MSITTRHHSDDAPSGANMEYEKVFTDLMLAAQPEEERQAGNEIIPGQDPDPKAILKCAEAVLEQSNDLRAAILYGYARLRVDGLPGLQVATGYLRTCLDEYWDTCHPQLDADDDNDPTMRVNSVLALVDKAMMLRALRSTGLTRSPAFGQFGLREIAMADGEMSTPEGMENPPTKQAVSAAFQDTPAEYVEASHAAAVAVLDDLNAINAIFDDKLPGQGPNLSEIIAMAKKIVGQLSAHVAAPAMAEVGAPGGAPDGAPAAAGAAPAAAPPGTIASQADVKAALGRIIDYYATHEPSSPLPILLERARRLVGADFMTIMADIAPLGMDNVRLIGGMENPE